MQAARLRAQLEHIEVGGVVDPQRRALERLAGLEHLWPVVRATWPLRSLSPGILAWQAMKRWASSVTDISSENSATGLLVFSATFSAMLVTSALLPIEGRAASTIRLRLEAARDVVEVAKAGRACR